MFPVLVVVGIDVIENLDACVCLVEEAAVLEHLAFEGTEVDPEVRPQSG